MSDIRNEKYAEWLEGALKEMVDLKPKKIAICCITADGSTATNYFNCHAGDIASMVGSMQQDGLFMALEVNADWLRSMLGMGAEDEGEVSE